MSNAPLEDEDDDEAPKRSPFSLSRWAFAERALEIDP
jgi:hypothetical protein